MARPVVLLILDGWGISKDTQWNAIAQGVTPLFDRLDKERPYVAIDASGEQVGLPAGQMGNSEVGHLNIGAGRVVYQDLLRVTVSIRDGSFFENEALKSAVERAVKKGSALHLMGLVSDGGVHSHIEHLYAFLDLAKRHGLSNVFVHAFMDGRDTPPDSGLGYIQQLEAQIAAKGVGKIATVTGRFYAMDRDNRWERVNKAHDCLTRGAGLKFATAQEAMADSYTRKVTDEFVEPSVITGADGEPVGTLSDGDEVIMFNFRADRMREITRTLFDPAFAEFPRQAFPRVSITCLAEYDAKFPLPVAYGTHIPKNGLGEVLARNGLKQFRTAETEKYAHVTFFFNGGMETTFEGESRKLVPSPRVRTYDLQPEMSCPEVTDGVVEAVESGNFGVIIVNLANGDMVGHTGIWEAALKAVNVVDTQVGRIVEACAKTGAHLLITADHGNIECMVENGKPMTAHTTNPAPFYYIGPGGFKLREGGRLADIAPTMLKLLGLPQPEEMTGKSLLE
ncbi:MAG: 2,3-bisphosphoglycerate-independent phosphoglycerate mutase [Nitrospinae bacterium]|nr:2,3-bisphosphoglycerate-independent phosphoglycerate mutase [Nitrospinota bacterium]